MAPIDIPARTLNAAIDFLALVVTGFCPAIWVRSLTSGSSSLVFCVASPRPMLSTIFSNFGTAMGFSRLSSFCRACLISLLYFSLSLAAISLALFLPVVGVAVVAVYRCGRVNPLLASSLSPVDYSFGARAKGYELQATGLNFYFFV